MIVKLSIDIDIKTAFSFSISIGVYAGVIFLFLIIAIFSRFRLSAEEGVKMAVLYFLFIVTSTIIIGIDI